MLKKIVIVLISFNSIGFYAQEGGLFEVDNILKIKILYNPQEINNDRDTNAHYHDALLSLYKENGEYENFKVGIKTRGLYRLKRNNCFFPPLRIKFNEKETAGTIFSYYSKIKLVLPCQKNDRFEQYVLLEYLAYKIYNLITEYSFRVRLVKLILVDITNKKPTFEKYAFIIEPTKLLEKRNNSKELDIKNIHPDNTDYTLINQMSLFQYLIGNTDWSVKALHNIKLLWRDSLQKPVAVPFDFDFSGLVNAPYALPAESLPINSVKERYYNGYARKLNELEANLLIFKEKKEDIYHLVHSIEGLEKKYIDETLEYFDQFYLIADHPEKIQHEFILKCRKE